MRGVLRPLLLCSSVMPQRLAMRHWSIAMGPRDELPALRSPEAQAALKVQAEAARWDAEEATIMAQDAAKRAAVLKDAVRARLARSFDANKRAKQAEANELHARQALSIMLNECERAPTLPWQQGKRKEVLEDCARCEWALERSLADLAEARERSAAAARQLGEVEVTAEAAVKRAMELDKLASQAWYVADELASDVAAKEAVQEQTAVDALRLVDSVGALGAALGAALGDLLSLSTADKEAQLDADAIGPAQADDPNISERSSSPSD